MGAIKLIAGEQVREEMNAITDSIAPDPRSPACAWEREPRRYGSLESVLL